MSWLQGRPAVGKGPGRGAWLCAGRRDCFERAARSGRLARALRADLASPDLAALEAALFGFG